MMAMNFKFRVPRFLKSGKYSLAAVNVLFLLTGVMLLIVGIIALTRYSNYDQMITNKFFTDTGFVIATGVIIILGSILGFYAAISQDFMFVAVYVVLLLIVLIFEIGIVITSFAQTSNAEADIRSTMVQSLQFYGTRLEVTKLWDDLQKEFECCGVAGRFDWISNQIPVSCCHIDYGTISPFECHTTNAFSDGCATVLGEYLAQQAYIIAVSATVAMSLQVVLLALGSYLAWRTKYEDIVELES